MDKTTNPAYALLKILQKVVQVVPTDGSRQIPLFEGWMKVFNLETQEEVLRIISDMNILYLQLITHIDKSDEGEMKSLQMGTAQKIKEIIGIEYINQSWVYIYSKSNEILRELTYLANNLHGEWIDKEISSDKLEEWRKELLEIVQEISSSDLPEDAKSLFLKLLKEIIKSIDLYILWGNEGISEAIIKYGVFSSSYEKKYGKPISAKLTNICKAMWLSLQVASCILQISGFSGKDFFLP
jgi:hypothetical protein